MALGVGSVNGVARKEKVGTLHAHAARNAFSPPGTPGVQFRGDYFGGQNPAIRDAGAQNLAVPSNLLDNPAALDPVVQPFMTKNSVQIQNASAEEPIAQHQITQYPAPNPAPRDPPAQEPIAEHLITQNPSPNPPALDSLPQNPLAQNPVEPHPLVNGVEDLQLTPVTAGSGNVPPPISRKTTGFVTPAAYPPELEKRFPWLVVWSQVYIDLVVGMDSLSLSGWELYRDGTYQPMH